MPKYEVQVTQTFTAWIEVEADDEDEAHDEAVDEAKMLSDSDWTADGMYNVESVNETGTPA